MQFGKLPVDEWSFYQPLQCILKGVGPVKVIGPPHKTVQDHNNTFLISTLQRHSGINRECLRHSGTPIKSVKFY